MLGLYAAAMCTSLARLLTWACRLVITVSLAWQSACACARANGAAVLLCSCQVSKFGRAGLLTWACRLVMTVSLAWQSA